MQANGLASSVYQCKNMKFASFRIKVAQNARSGELIFSHTDIKMIIRVHWKRL